MCSQKYMSYQSPNLYSTLHTMVGQGALMRAMHTMASQIVLIFKRSI
jgi:hypothetical protein